MDLSILREIERIANEKSVQFYSDYDVDHITYKFLLEYNGLAMRFSILDDETEDGIKSKILYGILNMAIDDIIDFRKENPEPYKMELEYLFAEEKEC